MFSLVVVKINALLLVDLATCSLTAHQQKTVSAKNTMWMQFSIMPRTKLQLAVKIFQGNVCCVVCSLKIVPYTCFKFGHCSGDYQKARGKCRLAEETSNVETEAEILASFSQMSS